MKSYEEYLRSHDGWHEMVAQLHRDILAELELINEVRARQARWLGELNDRIAKLEEEARKP
jgi:hypothetical protein